MSQEHITYVGPPELHDGHLLAVERAGERATVRVRGADGHELALEFTGVTALTAARPEGMLIFGLAAFSAGGEQRQFFFANWEEWDDAGLEITARTFRVLPEGGGSGSEVHDPAV